MRWFWQSGVLSKGMTAAAALFLTPTAAAQATTVPLPQTFTMSPGGVELRSGNFLDQHDDVSIGNLTLQRTNYGVVQTQGDDWPLLENGFDHNFRIGVKMQRSPRTEGGGSEYDDWLVTVHIGITTYAFKRPYLAAQPFVQTGGVKGRSLTWTGGSGMGSLQTYTFTDRDDTIYVFRPMSFVSQPDCGASTPCAYVASITKPSGERMDFTYDTYAPVGKQRLRTVRSNRGYALGFDYSALQVTKACAINLATTVYAAGNNCPLNIPTATYAYGSNGLTYTDPTGGVYVYGPNSIKRPGDAQPWVTWTVACCTSDNLYYIDRQDFADGGYWTYTIFDANLQSSFTGPNGTTTLQFDQVQRYATGNINIEYVVSSGPSSITDPLSRTTLTQYCGSGSGPTCVSPISPVPLSQTMPEGNKATYTHDSFDNIIKTVLTEKSGPGPNDREISATYAYSVPGGKTKPLTITDARGKVTDYTYESVRGLLISEKRPADNDGKRPEVRYTHGPYNAWILNAAGTGYVADANAVYLLETERFCRTSNASGTGCAAGAGDLVLTTYNYGPNSGTPNQPNTLLLRGKALTADGVTLRTCYGYDARANKISETTPRAGLSSCP